MMNRKGFSLGCSALAGAALLTATAGAGASTVISHSGNVDPTTTGWTLQSLQDFNGITILDHDNVGVSNDLGTHDAWKVARSDATYNGTGAGGGINNYKYTFSTSDVESMKQNGFVISSTMRPGDAENSNNNSRALVLSFWGEDSANAYSMTFWSNLTIVAPPGSPEPRNFQAVIGSNGVSRSGNYTNTVDLGTTVQYYDLAIVYDPTIHQEGELDFYINGNLVFDAGGGFSPFTNYQDDNESFLTFGDNLNGLWSNTSPTSGTSYWASVDVSTIPEPASAALLGLGGLLLARRRQTA